MHSTVFSIIVPAYNVAGYIEECIMSVCQTDPKWEIIVVDDGSTDGTGDICDRLAEVHENLTVIHKENGGLSSARNCGLMKAAGEYVVFVDGDDYIDKNAFAGIRKCIETEPDVVFCETVKIWEDGRKKPMGDGITGEINALEGAALLRYLSQANKFPASACGKAFRRDFLIENNLLFKEGILSEDIEWSLRLYPKVSRANYCKDTLYYYRQARTGSITSSRGKQHAIDLLNTVEMYADEFNRLDAEKPGDELGKGLKDLYRSFLEYELRVLWLKRNDVTGVEADGFRKRLKKLKYLTGFRKDLKSRLVAILYRMLI